MKNRKFTILLTTVIMLSTGLAACGQIQGSAGAELTPTAARLSSSPDAIVGTNTQDSQGGDPETEAVQSSEVPAEKPTPRVGLAATDPSIVSLGSGEIQLIEFFAFW